MDLTAHRALSDVVAMEELFTEKSLVDLLTSLPLRSVKQQLQLWNTQKEQRRRTSNILYSLGRQITSPQAKRLDELHLSVSALCEIRASCSDDDEFQTTLMQRGVRSKKLREKLTSALTKRK